MWLVADSGSTKTEWILFDSRGEIKQVFTAGLNPLFLTQEEFTLVIAKSLLHQYSSNISQLWFYGAGCSSETIKRKTEGWLQQIFKEAKIEVVSDLLAAARATCGNKEGLVAILGTGSNSCFYNGEQIKEQINPLGFILGDEGSGAALGKALLKKLLRNQLPNKLTDAIYKDIGLDYNNIIKKLYQSKWPNRFLASCAEVMYKHKSDKEIAAIIEKEFDNFVSVLSAYNKKLPVSIIGSVAHYFEQEVKNSLSKVNLKLGLVIKSPAKALVNYHQKYR